MVLLLICALLPGCGQAAQFYIPLGYALTGLCIALLMSPTPVAAVVGLVLGGLVGAAVYNNSLKRQILEGEKTGPRTVK
jgi:hypothetical protein